MLVSLLQFLAPDSIPKLADHWPTIVASTVFWYALHIAAEPFSRRMFPKAFNRLSPRHQEQWCIRTVSFFHACVATALSIPLINHPVLADDPLHGYWWPAGQVFAISLGYFIYDVSHCAYNVKQEGFGFLLHGAVAVIASLLSYKPLYNLYAPTVLVTEISTPFLNIHWFLDKMNMTGSTLQLANGAMLLITFFGARILFSYYWSAKLYIFAYQLSDQVDMLTRVLPALLLLTLNALNFFWFFKIVNAIVKRFKPPTHPTKSQ
ncbi:hypothetical protein H4R34_003985 [Dimargaris verticillata]|uniref:TLC domain-containing protein n=1 Tax=Dimargaris verticillata TaxID=2761393 RepID=A0A9W8B3H5_9FUNG|nr:hypothetical protein H4R34_003985 [Dimargaris verticillata]